MSDKPRLLIAGDSLIDRYLHTTVERLNPEAPGVVYKHVRTEDRPGGAAAVAMLCEALGADVDLVPGTNRCIKHRIIANGRLLFDRIDFDAMSDPIDTNALVFRDPHCVICADYGKGAVGDDLVPRLRRALPNTPIIVDPARGRSWQCYEGADCIKANMAECQEPHSDFSVAPVTIVTLGGDGMDLHGRDGKRFHLPTKRLVPVDPTGCGDSAIATIAVCIARGFDYKRACELANRAGAIQCGRIGVSAVYWKELEAGVPAGFGKGEQFSA